MKTILRNTLLIVCAATLAACVAEGHAGQPRGTEYRVISNDVEGSTYDLRAIDDSVNGVTCYTQGYHSISCVKTGPARGTADAR